MHPLHDYIAKQVRERIKSRAVVVWYDRQSEFVPFVAELRASPKQPGELVQVALGNLTAWLGEYDGSFLELRALIEPHVCGDSPDNLIVYLPGCESNPQNSVLLEAEKAGTRYAPQLRQLARNLLRQRHTDGLIDDILAPAGVTYEDIARGAADSKSSEPPSLLKAVFHDARGNDGLLAAWLASDRQDSAIKAKQADAELVKLVRSRIGLELPHDAPLSKLRSVTARYVLAGDLIGTLRAPLPSGLVAVPAPKNKDDAAAVCDLARRLRTGFPDAYAYLADRVEQELGLADAGITANALASIETFRLQERILLTHCGELIAGERYRDALTLIGAHENSFWLLRDLARKAQWEACRRMAELGAIAASVRAQVPKTANGPRSWIAAYTSSDGWYRMDQAQRRLELLITHLEQDPEERPLGVVRRAYEDGCGAMASGFARALARAKWSVDDSMPQTRIYSEVVAASAKPVAYFLVDAMRFEMGVELAERLRDSAEVNTRAAVCALPSITPVGMAALLPGASSSFDIVEQGGALGARIDESFLPDSASRRKFTAARIPNVVQFGLDELLSFSASRLRNKIGDAQVVFVKSQEIDHAGEAGFTHHARQIMDSVIDNLGRAIRKLAALGVENAVITADHGHLFFPEDRDELMRIDRPGGKEVELHRRCWIGYGGTTPPGCIRVDAAALGYASDLEFVFPTGSGVFKAGGDLAFHHGGVSLQELIVPVITARLKTKENAKAGASSVTASELPEAVTNRIFSVTLQLGKNLSLFSGATLVRPLLISAGRQVGAACMAVNAEFDRETACVKLSPGQTTTVAFLLSDDSATSLRILVQDPATDAELYRSPAEIAVRLGL